MDLMYLSENFSFNSYRAPVYEKYKKSWSNEEKDQKASSAGKNNPVKTEKVGKQHCKLCQEKTKKPLASYFRQKSTCDANNCIAEEEGEE